MAQPTVLPPLVRGEWIPMTWEEFLEWAPAEGQSEWVDGGGIAYVSNSARHVDIVVFLAELLGRYLRVFTLGKVFVDTMLLRLPTRPSGRMPDVFVVGRDDLDRIQPQWVEGPVLLAIEILSEGSADQDLVEKRAEYERAGIAEYVVIDARSGRHEFVYLRLDTDGRYQPLAPDADGRYRSAAFPEFWLDPAWFWQDPLPDVEDILWEMVPDAYEAWLLAKRRARGAAAETP
jgi:Uma2 family endonuclease